MIWLKIIRPQTLFASLVPVMVALLIVFRSFPERVTADMPVLSATLTAVCALALQILSNLINDYYDFIRGTDKAGRVGFSRALAEKKVTKKAMLTAILITVGIAVAIGLYLVVSAGWVILAIGVSALLFAWLYTATSHSLSYLGIADVFVLTYYGVIASAGTAYILTSDFITPAFYAGAVSGLISMCVLMINNLRDEDDDRSAGKRTPVVRFGRRVAHTMLFVYALLMPVFAFLAFGYSPAMLIVVPAVALCLRIMKAKGAEYNKCLIMAGLMNVVYFILAVLS